MIAHSLENGEEQYVPWEDWVADESTVMTFGRLALQSGFLEDEELDAAVMEQEARRKKGHTSKLGQILVQRGSLTEEEVTRIFELQGTLGGHTELEGYDVIEQIGQGSMGRIYKARQLSMNRVVALKVLSPKLAMDSTYVKRFLRESRLAGKLRHENVVFVLDAGISNGVHYYVMEYVEGRTLKEILGFRKKLSEKELVRLALHMARALAHAHSNGVVHRDVKPSNIIVSNIRVPKLCDFGLAKDLNFDPSVTSAGTVLGTPLYISPEQIRGTGCDIRSDIYSLGATLYHCACGSAPFISSGGATVMLKHLTEEPTPIEQKAPGISEEMAETIHRMLSKEPDGRFQTPTELWRRLVPLAYGETATEVEVEELPDEPDILYKAKHKGRGKPKK